jgi:hypothetical protein
MYFTDIPHFFDEEGNIPEGLLAESKEFVTFLTFLIEAATKQFPENVCSTNYPCSQCDAYIITELSDTNGDIHWFCPNCENEGIISNWKGTRWNKIAASSDK